LHRTVVVEIQFPIDDFPEPRIAVCAACEAELGAVPGRREFLRALHRFAGLEAGNGIILLHGDVVEGACADLQLGRSDRGEEDDGRRANGASGQELARFNVSFPVFGLS
jgi:hypothetical protein